MSQLACMQTMAVSLVVMAICSVIQTIRSL